MQSIPGSGASTEPRKRLTHQSRWLLAAKQEFKCNLCSETLGVCTHVDHIIPLANGGNNSLQNLQMLCVECHNRKTTLEARSRAAPDGSCFCEWCDVIFSKHFMHSHMHF